MAPGSNKPTKTGQTSSKSSQQSDDCKTSPKETVSQAAVKPIKLTSNKVFDEIEPTDKTVEICGYVDTAKRPELVGKGPKYNLLKFILNNNCGKRVQCVAWQDQVDRMKSIVELNKIIHLNGAVAKKIENQANNLGNVPYQLIIQEHTEVETKGFFEDIISNDSKAEPEPVEWENVAEMEGRFIKIDGWLKLMFNETTYRTGEASYSIGAITNGVLKLTVRIVSSTDLPKTLTKGCALTVDGTLQYDGNNPYIKVARGSDVRARDDSMMEEEAMMEVSCTPRKKAKLN